MESAAAMSAAGKLVRISSVAHYLDPPQSKTADLSKLQDDLPNWVTPIAWTVVYKEWVF